MEFNITTCLICYKHNEHLTKDCPHKGTDFKRCSLCSSKSHTFKTCNTEHRKCLNCNGPHSTLAPSCPAKKETKIAAIKNMRQQENTEIITPNPTTQQQLTHTQTQSTAPIHTHTFSYAQAASSSNTATSTKNTLIQNRTILSPENQPQNRASLSPENLIQTDMNLIACMLYAHIENSINPGTFNKSLHNLFKLNKQNITFNFPDNPDFSQKLTTIQKPNTDNNEEDTSDSSQDSQDTTNSSQDTSTSESSLIIDTHENSLCNQNDLHTSTPHSSPKANTHDSPVSPIAPTQKGEPFKSGFFWNPKPNNTIATRQKFKAINPSTIKLKLYADKKHKQITEIDTLQKYIHEQKLKFTYEGDSALSDVTTQIIQGKFQLTYEDIKYIDTADFDKIITKKLQKTAPTKQKHNV
ncbi:unnamed protein product [Rotaria magnacalcarata]|nr:unnamed protein product [Rotaria magnacalcarata]